MKRFLRYHLTPALAAGAATFALAMFAPAMCAAASAPHFHVRRIKGPLAQPTWVGTAPGSGKLFVAERRGRILVWVNGHKRVFLDLRKVVGTKDGEQGLLSVAFHANYASNHRYWVYYVNKQGNGRVYEFKARGNAGRYKTHRRILEVPLHPAATNHNGGHLVYGSVDHDLYLSVGDGGPGGDPRGDAQDRTVLRGKLLRIDVDHGYPYTIPADNPYAGSATYKRQIFAIGLRNPWRFSIDPTSGDIHVADVGQGRREEVDRLVAGAPIGANFGWRRYEGTTRYSNSSLARGTTHTPPVFQYGHSRTQCSITGGLVYRASRVRGLRTNYLYADYCGRFIGGFRGNGGGRWRRSVNVPGIVSFGVGPKGDVYFTSIKNGNVYRIVK
jgi:glucose/arabinose dehydrogenase